jgi:hypothetical protein
VLLLAVAYLCAQGLVPASASTVRPRPPQFDHLTGWQVRVGTVQACPGVSASLCSQATSTASTLLWRDCIACLPHRTVAAMSASDIAIQITVAVERQLRLKPTFVWPPHVGRGDVRAAFEGLPSRIGVYQGTPRVGTREVTVFIFFGRSRPTDQQLSRANAEMRRARLNYC